MGSRIALSTVELLEVGAYGLVPSKMAHYCRSKTETILQVHGVGPFSIDLVDPGYEMTAAGAGLMGGSPAGSRPPSAESVSSCFKLRTGDRVRGALGDGTVVGAQSFPPQSIHSILDSKGERRPILGDARGFEKAVNATLRPNLSNTRWSRRRSQEGLRSLGCSSAGAQL